MHLPICQYRGIRSSALRRIHTTAYSSKKEKQLREYSVNCFIRFSQISQELPPIFRVLGLLWDYTYHTIYAEGYYEDIFFGICRGCPLSPLMGTLYLKHLDDRMATTGLFYARFMDDVVILAPTRWKLRAAIKKVNQTLGELKLERHPEKTFIGRISRGFDFLGYAFTPSRLGIAPRTFERFVERMTRLYEQGAGTVRIGEYARRWGRWVRAGLGDMKMGVVELDFRLGSFFTLNHKNPLYGLRACGGLPKADTMLSYMFCCCTIARQKSY